MRLIPSINTLPSGATRAEGQLDKGRSCAVIPNKSTDDEGFIDTRNEFGDRKIFVSVTAVKEMARLCGYPDDAEVKQLVADFEATIQEYKDELERLNKLAKIIDLKKASKLVKELT